MPSATATSPSLRHSGFTRWNRIASLLILGVPLLGLAQPGAWSLSVKQVQAGKPFTLQLLNAGYGKCSSTFSHLGAEKTGKGLALIFNTVIDSAKVCNPDTKPWGPAFDIDALSAGEYTVSFWEVPACYPDCHVIPGFKPVDTLTAGSTAVLARTGASSDAGMRFQGNPLSLFLPADSGPRSVELRSVTGMLLETHQVSDADEALVPVGAGLGRGLFLVRVVSATGEIRSRKLFKP
ncbi:MAG: hypothetical protein JWO30_1249 [Fibrobacteres bacterium]|nr:hypothetical protein [Fibrobacterota bacterium]